MSLNKDICKKCHNKVVFKCKGKNMWASFHDKLWNTDRVYCSYASDKSGCIISSKSSNPPKSCPFTLEQILAEDKTEC